GGCRASDAARAPEPGATTEEEVAERSMGEVSAAAPLPGEAWAVALSGLPYMGPHRLTAALACGPPGQVWRAVADRRAHRDGRLARAMAPNPDDLATVWATAAAAVDVDALWQQHVDAGVGVALHGQIGYPMALHGDHDPPAVLFSRGDPDILDRPRVAVIGTRRCSRYGHDLAFEFGRDLATAGVVVVSGLALGIDGAAHRGAIVAERTPPAAVVGSGLDVIYPRANASLWAQIERCGVVLSEAPLGARPTRWRFPARNRIIAALADVVVVVESHAAGGSLLTVGEAIARDRPVMAVPGPVRSSASSGTNALLADGAAPARDVDDVLTAIGLIAEANRTRPDHRPAPTPADQAVLEAVGWQPATVEQLATRTATGLVDVVMALERLLADGWIAERGGWWERVARGG
ncbi:MAG: DNA-processing protein DprA, partial [Acidimicrobiales bacterium]